MKYVAYYRVSTQKQGISGLGLEAQRTAVNSFVQGKGEVVAEYTEIESGRRCDRPQLDLALAHTKRVRGTLVIAKLDRLARNVLFLAQLIDRKVAFVACDNPHANKMTLHILSAVAEGEADMISQRVKDALAAAKSRGIKLGGPRPLSKEDGAKGRARVLSQADTRWKPILPRFDEAKKAGCVKLREFVDYLNQNGVPTPTEEGSWAPGMVRRGLRRLSKHVG